LLTCFPIDWLTGTKKFWFYLDFALVWDQVGRRMKRETTDKPVQEISAKPNTFCEISVKIWAPAVIHPSRPFRPHTTTGWTNSDQ
jgi:hypothetical protein